LLIVLVTHFAALDTGIGLLVAWLPTARLTKGFQIHCDS